MNWPLTISIALNIVALLVYLKIPEFLQHIFIRRIEHRYNIELDVRNKNREVLPELFFQVLKTKSYYEFNYTGERLMRADLIEYSELKNYITQHQFFIDKDIRKEAREIEREVLSYIQWKSQTYNHPGGDKVEELAHKQEKALKKLDELIDSLERKIEKELED